MRNNTNKIIGREEEILTFSSFANSHNINEKDLLSQLKEQLITNIDSYNDGYRKLNKNDSINELQLNKIQIDSINTINDFFDYIKYSESYFIDQIREQTLFLISIFNLNNCINNDFNEKFRNHEEIKLFFENIIHINTFYGSIDSTIYIEDSSKEIIIVRNNFMYDVVLSYTIIPLFVNFSTKIITNDYEMKIHLDDKLVKRNVISNLIYEIVNLFNNKNFMESIQLLINREKHQNFFNYESNSCILFGTELYHGLKFYSNFHEYGHILYNHLNIIKNNLSKELEADIFAVNALVYHSITFYNNISSKTKKDSLIGIKCLSPLIYFLIKIAQTTKCNLKNNTVIFRFYFIKFLIEIFFDSLNLLEYMHDILSDIEVFSFQLLRKNHKTKSLTKDILKKAKKIEENEINFIIYNLNNFPNVKKIPFKYEVFSKYWYEYIKKLDAFA